MLHRFTPKSKIIVQTKSGITLGRLQAIEVDSEGGRVRTFHVSADGVLPRLLDREILITWEQIVEWNPDVLIVSDTAVPIGSSEIAFATPPMTDGGAHFQNREG